MKTLSFILILSTVGNLHAATAQFEFNKLIKPFLSKHCQGCHGVKKQKGKRRFDQLGVDLSKENTRMAYEEIVDQLNLGEMPPEDEAQPKKELKKQAISWLSARLTNYHQSQRKPASVLRRMNNVEYRNTIGDLLNLNTASFNPAANFPAEEAKDGFITNGEALVTSNYLLEKYLEAADSCIEKPFILRRRPRNKCGILLKKI